MSKKVKDEEEYWGNILRVQSGALGDSYSDHCEPTLVPKTRTNGVRWRDLLHNPKLHRGYGD